jgi:hypothetical protein
VTPARNLAAIAADGLVPQIGVRSERAGETDPFVHCFTSFEGVANALSRWMAEQFEEAEKLALLVINRRSQPHTPDGCTFGVTLRPQLLWVLADDIKAIPDFAVLRNQECVMIKDYMTATEAQLPMPEVSR